MARQQPAEHRQLALRHPGEAVFSLHERGRTNKGVQGMQEGQTMLRSRTVHENKLHQHLYPHPTPACACRVRHKHKPASAPAALPYNAAS